MLERRRDERCRQQMLNCLRDKLQMLVVDPMIASRMPACRCDEDADGAMHADEIPRKVIKVWTT